MNFNFIFREKIPNQQIKLMGRICRFLLNLIFGLSLNKVATVLVKQTLRDNKNQVIASIKRDKLKIFQLSEINLILFGQESDLL